MNWTPHYVDCRPPQGDKASEHSAMSKRDVCQERQCCEGQVGCLALALCLCHFCMLVLPFRQMEPSTAWFRTDSNICILQVCSHSLWLSSWGSRKVPTITHNESCWECGKVSPVQRAPAIHHHHHISEFLEVCMLAFSGWATWQSNLLPTVQNFGWTPIPDFPRAVLSILKAERENCRISGSVPLAGESWGLGLMCQSRMGFSKWHANAKEGVICAVSSWRKSTELG